MKRYYNARHKVTLLEKTKNNLLKIIDKVF
jgi:hypothetical protein